ncbi:hypothetical protein [Pantoea dispersa]|uniref:hypothetical protein n=1 Tax=Pantoea dispersa TaxID=59814 RepID=UPI0021CA0289|nr:hypothetical protein [Pantoea dispersa]UXO69007.1 hypothetical protein N7977_02930 [Pantoea dispersa]
MKKRTASVLTLLALLACQPLTAHAGRIKMQLTEQEETANGKTFDTNDSDERRK